MGMGVAALYVIACVTNYHAEREKAFYRAKQLVKNKGIANIGCGVGRYKSDSSMKYANDASVFANIDSEFDPEISKLIVTNAESPLPFGLKEFDVVFASHVLEHIEDWKAALTDWLRIADKVVIVLPHPWNAGQLKDLTHKRFVGFDWIEAVKKFNKNIEVFF